MPKIGIYSDIKILLEYLENSTYKNVEIVKLKSKECLSKIDVLVLGLESADWLLESINWLLSTKEHPKIFPWVITPNKVNAQEEEILLSLGAVSVLKLEETTNNITYSIKNIFSRLNEKEKTEQLKFVNDNLVLVGKDEKKLTNIEYNLLLCLYNHKNVMVSYNDIYQSIWGDTSLYNPDYSRIKIANIVFRLRKMLKGSDDFEIITIRDKGYIFSDKTIP